MSYYLLEVRGIIQVCEAWVYIKKLVLVTLPKHGLEVVNVDAKMIARIRWWLDPWLFYE